MDFNGWPSASLAGFDNSFVVALEAFGAGGGGEEKASSPSSSEKSSVCAGALYAGVRGRFRRASVFFCSLSALRRSLRVS